MIETTAVAAPSSYYDNSGFDHRDQDREESRDFVGDGQKQLNDDGAVTNEPPTQPSFIADHCYGLPYQDHNYGAAKMQQRNYGNENYGVQGSKPDQQYNNSQTYSSTTNALTIIAPPLDRAGFGEDDEVPTTVEILSPVYSGNEGSSSRPNDNKSPIFFQQQMNSTNNYSVNAVGQQQFLQKPGGDVEVVTSSSSGIVMRPSRPRQPSNSAMMHMVGSNNNVPSTVGGTLVNFEESSSGNAVSHSYAAAAPTAIGATATVLRQSLTGKTAQPLRRPLGMPPPPSASSFSSQHQFPMTKQQQFAMVIQQQHQQHYEQQQRSYGSRVLTTPVGSVTSVNLLTPDRDHHLNQQYSALTGQSDVMLSSSSILNNSPPLNYHHMDHHLHHHSSYADPNSYGVGAGGGQPGAVDYNNNPPPGGYAMRQMGAPQPPNGAQMATDVKRAAGRPRGGRPTFYAPPNQQAAPNSGQAPPPRRMAPIVVGPAQAAQSRRQNSGSLPPPYNYAVQPGVGPTFYNGSTAQMQTIASGRIVQQGSNQYMDDGLPVVPIDLPEDPSCSDNFDFSAHHGGNLQHEAAMAANGLMGNMSQQQQSSSQQQQTAATNNDIFGDQCRSMFDRLFKELGVENDAEAASRAAAAVAELNELAKANKIDQAAEERFIKKYRRQLQDMARKRRLASADGSTPAKKPSKPKRPKKDPSSTTTTKPKKPAANQRGRPPKISKKDQDAAVVPEVKKEEAKDDVSDDDEDSQESDGEIADEEAEQENVVKKIKEQQSSSQQKIKATVDQLQAKILAKDRLRKKSEEKLSEKEESEEEGEVKSEKEETDEDEEEDENEGEDEHEVEDEETTSEESENEWEGQDYTTSCLCGMTHNDDFMIQCDKCEVWQHCDCMGLKKRSIPDKYLCHVCKPRLLLLTKDKARKLQAKKLAQMKAKKHSRKQKNDKNPKRKDSKKSSSQNVKSQVSKKIAARKKQQNFNTKLEHRKMLLQRLLSRNAKTVKKEEPATNDTTAPKILTDQTPMSKAKRREMLRNQKETFDEFYAAFTTVDANEYSQDVLDALREESDTVGASLLDQLPMGAPCLAMYVTKERRGLVANLTIPPDQPIFEYRGKCCSIGEFSGRDVDGYILPYVLFYRGLQKGDGSLSPKLDLCVDARFKGTDARFIRRSCQPNTQVKHVIKNGELHLLIISTELIESATEVTIPFDYDFRSCKYNVECACKVLSEDECPVERSNAERRAAAAALAANSRSTSPCPPAPPPPPPQAPPIPKNKQKNAGANLLPRGKYAPKKSKIKEAVVATAPSTGAKKKVDEKEKEEEHKIDKKQKPKFKLGFKIKLKEKKKTATQNKVEKEKEVEESSTAKKSKRNLPAAAAVEKKTPIRKRQNSTLVKSEESLTSPPIKKDKISEETGEDNEHDAREEKKMRQLLEQIARMEEREKKKKTTPKSRSNSYCEEKASKIKEFSSPKKEIKVESKIETENSTSTAVQPRSDSVSSSTNNYTDTESYVAKKRWLRQALSEGISSRTSSDENQIGPNVAGFSSPIFNMMSPNSNNDRQQPLQQPCTSENIFESNQPYSSGENCSNLGAEIETELIATTTTSSINETMEEGILGGADSRPSSSADSSTATPVQMEGEQIDQQKLEPKRKVRMSLDEYKKRKRDVPGESSNGAETTPTQQSAIGGGENSNDGMSGGDGSTTPCSSSNVAVDSSGRSFIPQLKESDLYAQPIRLGSLPDPRLIGRGSTSLEDLRKRIYGRTFNCANYQADGATEPSPRNAVDSAADAEAGDGQHRMSLMDRLKNEFGLDDHA